MSTPRGIRNNNPGNIRKSSTTWQGEVKGQDAAFETFATPEHGIRAIAKLLLTYSRKYGLNTPRKIAHRWAPPIENDSDAYAKFLAGALAVGVDETIDVEKSLPALIPAIIQMENGQQPYLLDVIRSGIAMAGVQIENQNQGPDVAAASTQPAAPILPPEAVDIARQGAVDRPAVATAVRQNLADLGRNPAAYGAGGLAAMLVGNVRLKIDLWVFDRLFQFEYANVLAALAAVGVVFYGLWGRKNA